MNLTCIVCPNSCELFIEKNGDKLKVSGHMCKRGIEFAENEIKAPKRVVCTTVKTNIQNTPRLPVKTDKEIPKEKIFDVMKEVNKLEVINKTKVGDILIKNVCGTEANIVATDNFLF